MSKVDLHELVNDLDNNEIITLLRIIFANRPVEVYIGMYPKNTLRTFDLSEENPVFLNGNHIQINTEDAFTDKAIKWQ
ncbi:MAG TPA: hypothetical protein DEO86_11240 [Colwellia sp.]|nr:hypothetical protein [Colwellia sp.]|tara:strand:- start:1177 stop:1410 length:234 start_codon:yes stop_codon:yes gene_type:complete